MKTSNTSDDAANMPSDTGRTSMEGIIIAANTSDSNTPAETTSGTITDYLNANNSNMFSITPMNAKLRLKAGETYEGVIKVFTPDNLEGKFYYKVSVAPYNVTGEDYQADLSTQSNRSKILEWISFDEPKGVLGPNETKEVHYTITVPEGAPGGGQYAVILIGSDEQANPAPTTNGMNIQNIYEMGSVIYAQVEGETIREGKINKNEIPGFVTDMPIHTIVELENRGNIHETATIQLEVNNFLNGTQIYPVNTDEGTSEEVIMPETTRAVVKEVKDLPALGIYEVTQNVDYLGQHSSITQVIVACPVWFMAMILIVVATIITGIVFAIKKHKKKLALTQC